LTKGLLGYAEARGEVEELVERLIGASWNERVGEIMKAMMEGMVGDLVEVCRDGGYAKLVEVQDGERMVRFLIRNIMVLHERFGNEEFMQRKEVKEEINSAMMVLFVPLEEEMRAFEEEAEDYHYLDLGGTSYKDSIKSLATKLYKLGETSKFLYKNLKEASKKLSYWAQLESFCQNFTNGYLKHPTSVQILLKNDKWL
jgi:hypothetical protein